MSQKQRAVPVRAGRAAVHSKSAAARSNPFIKQRGFYSEVLAHEAEEHLGVSGLNCWFSA